MTDYEKLISAHDGDMALYYIWLKENRSSNKEQAAKDLCMTMSRINAAEEMLIRYELFGGETHNSYVIHVEPARKDKHYVSSELVANARTNPIYADLIRECEKTLQAPTNNDDIEKLLDMTNNLGLSGEVIYVLLRFFASEFEVNEISMLRILNLAYRWQKDGITTSELAEEWVEKRKQYTRRERAIKSMLGIRTRLVGKTIDTIDSWVDAGYTDEMILKAYEITLEKTGKLSWAYMTRVLKSLAEGSEEEQSATPSLPTSIKRKKIHET